MTQIYLTAILAGLLVAIIAFVALFWTMNRERAQLDALVSGVRGEERLRLLEQNVTSSVQQLKDALNAIDKARGESLARLDAVVAQSHRTIETLQRSTARLADTLGNSQARGQLGEKLAEDVLRAAGFIENVNYFRNRQMDGGTTRPDFTFLLPEGRTLSMDVKFPIASYVRCVNSRDDDEQGSAERQFLADVRAMLRDVANRGYVNREVNTLSFMIVFVPNEQVYGFLLARDPDLADDAREMGVVLCSPLSLYSLLSVIRQAADAFALASDANEVLQALSGFAEEWDRYQAVVFKVGKRLNSAQRAYDEIAPRTRAINRKLGAIDDLLAARQLPATDERTIGESSFDR